MVSGIVLDVAAECACCRWPSNLVAATSCPTCFDADRLASPHQDDVGFRYAERRGMSPWSVSVPLQATELHPKVVVGVPADNVALRHPTPEYPRVALSLHISGDVVVTVRVENGRVMETTANSHSSPLLAYSVTRWVANQWKFKPSVSGVFTIPISYKESA
jgi:outer membrane biosynthesis protein TonB